MTDASASLLILEDSGVLLAGLMRWFNETFPRKSVLGVKSIAEAEAAMAAVPIDFFLVDFRLPDGNGLEFMHNVRAISPRAPFILMTLEISDEDCRTLMALNPVSSFRKPIDFGELEWTLRPFLEGQANPISAAIPKGFTTMLRGVLPLDLIQLKCNEVATCALEFHSTEGEMGSVYLAKGEIVHAETRGAIGIEALAEVIHWAGGTVHELDLWTPPTTVTIGPPWQSALMEAAQISDEGTFDTPASAERTDSV